MSYSTVVDLQRLILFLCPRYRNKCSSWCKAFSTRQLFGSVSLFFFNWYQLISFRIINSPQFLSVQKRHCLLQWRHHSVTADQINHWQLWLSNSLLGLFLMFTKSEMFISHLLWVRSWNNGISWICFKCVILIYSYIEVAYKSRQLIMIPFKMEAYVQCWKWVWHV